MYVPVSPYLGSDSPEWTTTDPDALPPLCQRPLCPTQALTPGARPQTSSQGCLPCLVLLTDFGLNLTFILPRYFHLSQASFLWSSMSTRRTDEAVGICPIYYTYCLDLSQQD